MTDKEYLKLLEFRIVHNALIPANDVAKDLVQNHVHSNITLKEATNRDIKFHRCYFNLIAYIYEWLPFKFTSAVPKEQFYLWLKHFTGSYDVIFEFKDGTKLIDYKSISFGKMSQIDFIDYVKNQLTMIYEDLIRVICEEPDMVIENIEHEFQTFLNRLK